MRKTIFGLLLSLVFVNYVFAQDNKSKIPNVSDPEWVLYSRQPVILTFEDGDKNINIPFIVEIYDNKTSDTRVAILSPFWLPNLKVTMFFGSKKSDGSDLSVAINHNGQWYEGKDKNSDFKNVAVTDKDGKVIGISISLDTIDGTKTVHIVVP